MFLLLSPLLKISTESKRANVAHYPHEEKTAHDWGNFLEIRRFKLSWQVLAVLHEPASAAFFSGLKPRKTSNFGDRLRNFWKTISGLVPGTPESFLS